jgi:hypothetical protein
MPKAPLHYKGYAYIQRPIVYYKNYIIPYNCRKNPESIKELDTREILYIETFTTEGVKEESITIWVEDENDPTIQRPETYTYFKPYDLYVNDDCMFDTYIYFIEVTISEEEYQQMSIERSKIIFEELVSKVFHPKRVIQWIEMGYDISIDEFY